jgi:hypothetical protein
MSLGNISVASLLEGEEKWVWDAELCFGYWVYHCQL